MFKNQYAGLVDSLSYVDQKLTTEQMENVKAAIKDFQKTFVKKNYLEEYPMP